MGTLVLTSWEANRFKNSIDTARHCEICKKWTSNRDLHQCVYKQADAYICNDCMQSDFLVVAIV